MARGPRVDIPNAVYHVIGRGVERRAVFRTDRDREDFLGRLATVVEEENLRLFAFVLMGTHFHLIVRREGAPLGHCMKRLLTGYGLAFNASGVGPRRGAEIVRVRLERGAPRRA
jgi:putative transposase